MRKMKLMKSFSAAAAAVICLSATACSQSTPADKTVTESGTGETAGTESEKASDKTEDASQEASQGAEGEQLTEMPEISFCQSVMTAGAVLQMRPQ